MKPYIKLIYDIPLPFKISTNGIYSGMHWQKRKSIADWYHRLTKEDCEYYEPFKNKVGIRYKFYFKTRCFDSSNCSFIGKMIEDSFVKNKLLTDDNNKCVGPITYESIRLEGEYRKKAECDYVRIKIYEL